MNKRHSLKPRTITRGVAAIELALMMSFVLVPLTFGVTELGRAAYQYTTLTKSARDAARYWSTVTPGSPALGARCLAVTGYAHSSGSSCTKPPLVPGLQLSMVVVCDRVQCSDGSATQNNLVPIIVNGVRHGTTNLVTVKLTGVPFTSLVSFIVPSFTFDDIVATFAQAA